MIRWQILFLTVFMSGALCRSRLDSPEERLPWDEKRVRGAFEVLTQEEHPLGSVRQAQIADWLHAETDKMGLESSVDTFRAEVPDPAFLGSTEGSVMQKLTIEQQARNVYAKHKVAGSDCVILIGSHYDTKRLAAGPYLGANDSASSAAAILEIMRQLKIQSDLRCSLMAVWFDGEEAWLPEWRDGEDRHPARQQDNLYGSRHMAGQLQACGESMCLPAHLGGEKVRALILLDMIGMPGVKLSLDSLSDSRLLAMAVAIDKSLLNGALYGRSYARQSTDDHIPFIQRGVPAIDLIDFDNLQTWHQTSDRPESVDFASIEKVSQLAMALVMKLNAGP